MNYKRIVKHPFTLVIVFGVLLRIALMFFFENPAIHNDTEGYIDLAQRLLKFNLSDYEGWRTPGYPLVLIFAGFNFNVVVLFQIILSICSVYFVYDIILPYSKRLAFVVSLFLITLINCISFDFSILTEICTQFFLIFSLWYIRKNNLLLLDNNVKYYVVLAVVLLFLFFVRPMYILISPILFCFHLFKLKRNVWRRQLYKAIIVLMVPFVGYFGWSYLNYINQNWFTVTTFYGINLSQNSYGFVEKLPEEHKVLKDLYLKHKETQVYEGESVKGFSYLRNYYFTQTNDAMTIWRAYPELLDQYDMNGPELSKELSAIFKELIINNPKEYLAQVFRSWTHFWNHNQYFKASNEYTEQLFLTFKIIWKGQKLILILANFLFFPLSLLSIFISFRNRNFFSYTNLIIAIVYASSILQAMVTYGENSRFAFPTFFLVVGFVAICFKSSYCTAFFNKIRCK